MQPIKPNMYFLKDLPKERLFNKTVIIRADLNVPINRGVVMDTFRIDKVLPTIKYLTQYARRVVVLSHIGRSRTESLEPVANELRKHFPQLHFTRWNQKQIDGKLVLMENLRQDPREVSKDTHTRMSLTEDIVRIFGESCIFVQDAFSVCHRMHASIVELPKILESYAGFLLSKEILELTKALNPPHPALFVLGGAKFDTKEPLIRRFLETYERIFIGGAIANEFFKERGYETGLSLVYNGKIPHDILYNRRIILPETVQVADSDGHTIHIHPKNLMPDMRIVDAIPPTHLLDTPAIKYVLWNGPLGYYEGGYTQGTNNLLSMLEGSDVESLTGGGDTLATIGRNKRQIFSHVSVGGGAMLRFLQGENMPGIKALG